MSDDRTPPQDIDAERSVLGAMLLSKDAIADVVDIMRGSDFRLPVHETIYDAITDMYSRGDPVDPVTVSEELRRRGELARIGGPPYVHTLSAEVPIASNADYYATIVHEKAILRRLIEAGMKVVQMGYAAEDDVEKIADAAQVAVMEAMPSNTAKDYQPIGATIGGTVDTIEQAADGDGVQGVPTGILDLDDLLGGLMPGQLIIVAGRPAMGKSVLAVDFCRSASIQHGLTSAFFSLEMSRHELTSRIIAAQARVALNVLKTGHLDETEWNRVAGALPTISGAPLFIDDSPNLTMTEIRAKARRLKQQHQLRLIVIDYMQLMTSGKKVENRQVEVSEFSRQMKLLAKELDVPVVALCQLNRGPEQRTGNRPMLADLRESGSLEQDADVVILLYREDMYNAKESTRPGEADIIVAKQRQGPTRDVTVAFQGHYSRFVDMAR